MNAVLMGWVWWEFEENLVNLWHTEICLTEGGFCQLTPLIFSNNKESYMQPSRAALPWNYPYESNLDITTLYILAELEFGQLLKNVSSLWKACLVLPQMWKSQDRRKTQLLFKISLFLPLTKKNLDQAKPSTFGRSICCCFQFHSRHRFFHTAGNFPVITFQTSITQLFPFLHFYRNIF